MIVKVKIIAVIFSCGFFSLLNAQDLVTTYHLALENDPQLKKAYYKQLSVGESKSQSIAQILPTLSVSGNSSRERIDNSKANFQSAGIQNYWSHGFTINFSQPIFHLDHWVQLSQSENQIVQVKAEYQAELQTLLIKTTEAYFNVLSAQDNLEFTVSEQKAIERQLKQAKQRFEVGLIAMTDVYEAQSRYDQAIASQIDAANLLDDNKEVVREIIGENEVSLDPIVNEINLLPPTPNNINEWSEIAESNNLNITAAINQAEVNRKAVLIQQFGHAPTLDLVANYGVQDVNSTFGFRGDTQSIGLQLNIPLFQGGMVHSRAKQANFDYQLAKENLIAVKRQVKRQLRNAFRGVISSLNRVKALKATVASAEISLEATQVGFEVGTRTMVDVFTEQSNLYRAKRDYSRSRYDYLINGVKLKQMTSNLTEQDLYLINQYIGHHR
ncbi:MAG: TolC family outer membrane protein [Methylococcales bacterium]|nr:TolC family outer membrane protein [Methylococcales bacterium]